MKIHGITVIESIAQVRRGMFMGTGCVFFRDPFREEDYATTDSPSSLRFWNVSPSGREKLGDAVAGVAHSRSTREPRKLSVYGNSLLDASMPKMQRIFDHFEGFADCFVGPALEMKAKGLRMLRRLEYTDDDEAMPPHVDAVDFTIMTQWLPNLERSKLYSDSLMRPGMYVVHDGQVVSPPPGHGVVMAGPEVPGVPACTHGSSPCQGKITHVWYGGRVRDIKRRNAICQRRATEACVGVEWPEHLRSVMAMR